MTAKYTSFHDSPFLFQEVIASLCNDS